MSSIEYTGDNVAFSSPSNDGTQTDYEALMSINFVRVNDDGTYTTPYLYVQNVTGASSYVQLLAMHQDARAAITDESLLAFSFAQDAEVAAESSSVTSSSSTSSSTTIPDPGA